MAKDDQTLTERQRNAVDELINAFEVPEQPTRKFLPYGFPRKLMQSEMTATASEEELEAAENSLFFWWWHFLKASSEYPRNEEDKIEGRIAYVYRKFGELGENFREWWKRTGRDLFSESEGTSVRVLYNSAKDSDDAPDTAEMLIVEILMHVPRRQIRDDLDLVLKDHHRGKKLEPYLLRRAKLTLYPDRRHDDKAFPNAIEVWDRAQKQTKRNWSTIGKGMKFEQEDLTALSTQVRNYYEQAERLMRYAVRGEFPKEYEEPEEGE